MRILMVTQWFDPEPTCQGLEFTRQLTKLGHEVEVLTGFPNYPEGNLYAGYRIGICQREQVDGIAVIRVPLYPSHDRSAVRRTLNYASFAVAAAMLGPALTRRPDVIYAYHPPGTVGLPALVLARWHGVPVVYDVQDLWPDTVKASGMLSNGMAIGLLDGLCRFVYRHADRVVVLSPGFRKVLIERGVSADRVSVIYNCAPEQRLAPARQPRREDGKFTIVFAGTMGLAQGLDTVLEAAALCASTVPQARFLFVGGGVDADRLRQRAERMRLNNVEFLRRQPQAAAQAIQAEASALLVHLKDDPLFSITIPSKTQAYLAAGRPIIMAVRGDAADLVVRSGAGILARPGDPESLADAVRRLAKMPEAERARMGKAGREFYEAELTLERTTQKLEAVLRDARRMPVRDAQVSRAYSGKRLLDLVLASAGILVTLPLCILIAALIRLCMGSPVFFRQKRAGFQGGTFDILKFRSMRDVRGADGKSLPDPARATALGNFLRKTSLDELPELINVLRGEMSMVGPRPLVADYLPRYTPVQAHRHDVLPGITGLAQVMGRQAIPFSERIQFDLWYIRHCRLGLDVAILLRTAVQVLFGSGVRLNQDLREVDDLAPLTGNVADMARAYTERACASQNSPEADLAHLAEAVSRNHGAVPADADLSAVPNA